MYYTYHTEYRKRPPRTTLTTQNTARGLPVPHLPHRVPQEAFPYHTYHTEYRKRPPRTTPTTQSTARGLPVPHLPHRVPQEAFPYHTYHTESRKRPSRTTPTTQNTARGLPVPHLPHRGLPVPHIHVPVHFVLVYNVIIVVCLQDSPDDALRIFTEDITEVKQLPRDRVLQHLETCAPSLSIPYLVRHTA